MTDTAAQELTLLNTDATELRISHLAASAPPPSHLSLTSSLGGAMTQRRDASEGSKETNSIMKSTL